MYSNLCIACGSDDIFEVTSLGSQSPANDLLESLDDEYAEYPLGLNACRVCGHGQLSYFVDPSELFKNYTYVSSTSQTMKDYMSTLAKFIFNVSGPNAKILEIGSNDGLFLKSLKSAGIYNFIGIDPAEDIVKKASSEGLKSVVGFWPQDKALIEDKDFDVIIGQNVFAHNSSPLESLNEVKNYLSQTGLAIFQTSQADMTINGEFDTIYHEHCSFFCESSMSALAERAGLKLIYTRYVNMHGTSSLYIMCHKDYDTDISYLTDCADQAGLASMDATGDKESQRYFRSETDWKDFSEEAHSRIKCVKEYVMEYARSGCNIVAVGAAAKAITFLRAADIQPSVFLDESKLKLHKYIAGLDVQISDFSNVSDNDFYIVTAWNFAPEIAKKLVSAGAPGESYCLVYFPNIELTKLKDLAL
jgi:SAM-dependent methyltransferase